MKENDIRIGDRFYHDNHCVHSGASLPDYLIVKNVKDGFVEAKYENHYIYTKERFFSEQNLWMDSNLNPSANNPGWIFLKNAAMA